MIEQRFGIQILAIWHEDPGGDADGFTRDVRVELNRILQSRAGRALADSLRFQKKTVLVMPYEGNDGNA